MPETPQDTPQPVPGLSRKRRALLGVYAALDPRLRDELGYVGLRLEEPRDPFTMLEAAAAEPDDPGRPRVHPLHLAFAAMRVLRRPGPPAPQARERLRRVAARLVDPEAPPGNLAAEAVEAVATALEHAAGPGVGDRDRWALVVEAAGDHLDPRLAAIRQAWCDPELRRVGDEVVSRIETRLVVRDERTIAELAPAVLPENWKHCNDFFCDLVRVPDRDRGCPGATGGDLTTDVAYWRGVYEERVGDCPAGWFPDTFLAFTWECTDRQLILRYELAPRRPGDRTVLRIDQGYIQVDRLPGAYLVSTVKYLLFDDAVIPGGGQTLGQSACQLGWLDCSVNQFTDCAAELSSGPETTTTTTGPTDAEIDADLQRVLDRCQAHLAETAADTGAQLARTMAKVRTGGYRVDDYVGDLGELVTRGIRDGARSVQGQLDLAMAAAEVARTLARRRVPRA
jgi:hypothetical protein